MVEELKSSASVVAGGAADNSKRAFKHMNFNVRVNFVGVKGSGTGEHEGIASNGKMIAVPWASTGAVGVFGADQPATFEANIPLLKGHQG